MSRIKCEDLEQCRIQIRTPQNSRCERIIRGYWKWQWNGNKLVSALETVQDNKNDGER